MNHVHICPCGTQLQCQQEPDRCAIAPAVRWQCPSCEQQELDDYFASPSEVEIAVNRLKEFDRAHHRQDQ